MDDIFRRGAESGTQPRQATARWALPESVLAQASARDGALRYEPGRIWLGVTLEDEQTPVGWHDDRHLVTIAGSRGGKGRSAIIPNLLLYPGSVVCIDPKGENARETAAIRAAKPADGGLGQNVFVFDPFETSGVSSFHATFNPLDVLDVEAPDAVEQAGLIADSLVVAADSRDAHWDENARAVIEALILHVATTDAFAGVRTLMTVRELLLHGDLDAATRLHAEAVAAAQAAASSVDYPDGETPPPLDPSLEPAPMSGFDALVDEMIRNPAFPNSIAGLARSLLDMGPEERGGVLSVARRNTRFLDGAPIHRVLGTQGRRFEFDALKRAFNGATVYLCLPTRYLSTHARWLRLMIACLMDAMERRPAKPRSGYSVLAICDEFPVLGPLKSLETAVGYMAGYHLRIWAILQDISQLRRDYPKSWETFLGNAGLIQFFANSDYSTLEFLSKRLGETEIIRQLRSVAETTGQSAQDISADARRIRDKSGNAPTRLDASTDTVSYSTRTDRAETMAEQTFKTALITPDEIAQHFRRATQTQGLICADARPIRLLRVNYDDPDFQSIWRYWREAANRLRTPPTR